MKYLIVLGALLFVSISHTSAQAQPVFFEGTGNHYQLISNNATFEEAEALAAEESLSGVSGHLVTLTSQEENDFLLDTFGGLSGWIGLFQEPGSIEPGQGFRWVTGENFVFSNFGGNEPNNAFGDEQFVEFFNGNWNDLGPTAARRYYIEFETSSIPEPSSLGILVTSLLVFTRRYRN